MKLKSKALLLDETIKLVSTLDANNNNNNSNKDDSPLSPLVVFKAGTILYETNPIARGEETQVAATAAEAAASYESLAETFYQLLANLNRDYLTFVIFKDINAAFISIVESSIGKLYTLSSTSTSSNTTNSNSDTNTNSNSNNTLETLLCSIRAICGIYDALLVRYRKEKCVMPCAFDVTLCNTLAILYDHLMDREMNMIRSNATGSNATSSTRDEEMENSMEELKTCILSILSSQILYGLIHPIIESGSLRESLNASTNTDTDTDNNTSEDDTIQKIMSVIQTLSDQSSSSTSTSTTSYCIGDLQKWQQQQKQLHIQNPQQYPIHHHRPIVELISTMFTKNVDAQKEYLISVLQSAPNSSDAKQQLQEQQQKQKQQQQQVAFDSSTKGKGKPKPKQKSAIKRLIEQVHTILPHLGEGYIEAALACYNHDIEITTNALMEDEYNASSSSSSSLHPRLRALDKSLPARKKESKEKYGEHHPDNGDVDVEEYEAKKIQKERIKEMEKTQEEEAYRLEVVMSTMKTTDTTTDTNTNMMEDNDAEYNDDYDDQYDGNGDDVGGADSGLYDVDYESIKAYNKIAKGMEEERKFWEGNANTNRSNNNNKNIKHGKRNKKNDGNDDNGGSDGEENGNEETGQKKYRGLDKGKGGRLIGPDGRYLPHPKSRKKGGGGGNQNQSNTNNNNNNNNTTTKNKKGTNAKANANTGSDAGTGTGATSKKGKTEKDKDGKKKDVEMTKIQKRRKNDNKSKIGNHHRKERALKKSGGM